MKGIILHCFFEQDYLFTDFTLSTTLSADVADRTWLRPFSFTSVCFRLSTFTLLYPITWPKFQDAAVDALYFVSIDGLHHGGSH